MAWPPQIGHSPAARIDAAGQVAYTRTSGDGPASRALPMIEPSQKALRRKSLREDALNVPNLLTMARVAAIPLVLWLMWQDTRETNFWAMMLYSAAAVTDFIDGWLARRMGLTSLLGKFLDPLADKLIVLATLVLMVEQGRVPAWAVIIIAARELSVTALRTIAMSEGVVIAASRGGKDKTAVQMVAVLALILHDSYYMDYGFWEGIVDMNAVGLGLLYLSVFFTITSAGEYVALLVDAVEAKDRRLAEQSDGES
jgi:CDP-diacylglycerol---glycerol-3-phosphate 3-phosphatidyltransferase